MDFPMILIPAWGRKYQSEEQCRADWEQGKDFKIEGGPYCSIRDLEALKKLAKVISIRWQQNLYMGVTHK